MAAVKNENLDDYLMEKFDEWDEEDGYRDPFEILDRGLEELNELFDDDEEFPFN